MYHIFISYSRKDLAIAEKIIDVLVKDDLEPWIDWKSIPKGEEFEREIQQGIEAAEIFLFLVSPDSIQSDWCNKEIAHAVKNGKRILPIVIRDTDLKSVHPEISKRNWIFCRDGQDDFNKAIEETSKAIHTDYEWVKYHTELQVKALKWEQKKDNSRLLRGKELREAEQQLASAESQKDPQLTNLQRNFIISSRTDDKRLALRTRIFGVVFSVFAMISIIAGSILLDRTPAKVNVEEGSSVFEIRNRFGYRFLRQDVGSIISVYSDPQKLTPDGGYTIIIGTDSDGERPGTVLAYDMKGNIKWEYDANFDPYYGPNANFSIKKIIVEQIMNDGEYQIVFTSQKTDWFPSQLVLLSAKGESLGSYWNPGFIYEVLLQDFDNDGIKEMAVLAVNNNLGAIVVNDSAKHPYIVYILSPKRDFSGQPFPELISDWPSGTEFENWIAVLEPYNAPGAEIKIVPDGSENLIQVKILPVAGYIYLEATGRIRRVGLSDGWQSQYEKKSPADFICFLKKESDGWYFPIQVDQEETCPWYMRE